ncbi:hypothetical protein ACTMTJ_13810 [Phytohabitans sp. LJ34]|uniref:hypothetical protein n=1 Tax=Phytohabitans sp. LJ34 TaxID=3452217 RepID=UPI003F8CBB6D
MSGRPTTRQSGERRGEAAVYRDAGFRTAVEALATAFRDEAAATMLVERLYHDGLAIDPESIKALPSGNTGARLVEVVLRKRTGSPSPRRRVVKLCPPGPFGRELENPTHLAALDEAPLPFRESHLTETAFSPVFSDRDWVVTGQMFAAGRPLSSLRTEEQIEACRTIREALLRQWTGDDYDTRTVTLAALVRRELRDNLETGRWLHGWARGRSLLDAPSVKVPGEDGALPNPFHLFGPDSPVTGRQVRHLVGRAHGDLHADNILIPDRDGVPHPAAFRLIDLSTYDGLAPLSRDVAALMMSLITPRAGASGDPDVRNALLDYLLTDHGDKGLARRVPAVMIDIVDVLRSVQEDFVREFEADWHCQIKVSLLAQAMFHAAYASGTDGARSWSLRLAGRLTRHLLGPDEPATGSPLVVASASPAAVEDEATIVDREPHRTELRDALLDDRTSIVVVHGPAGVGKTALVVDVLAGLGRLHEDSDRRVCWHEAALLTDVSIQTLIADIEGGIATGAQHLYGPRSRARLEIALDSRRETVPLIVLDAAEQLLDADRRIRDPELDLALETIANRRQSAVKVIIASQTPPAAHADITWPRSARSIDMSGLEPRFLLDYLRTLDPDGPHRDLRPSDKVFLEVHGRLAGNPRLADLLQALLTHEPQTLDDLAAWLTSLPDDDVGRRLVRRLADHLPTDQQLVVEALAAFGIPVEATTVAAVLEPDLPRDRCAEATNALLASRVIRRRRDGRLQVPPADVMAILDRIDHGDGYAEPGQHPTSLDLLHRAANELYTHQKDDDDVHTVGDLDMHFAQLDLYIRARMFGPAHELIASMDTMLRRWGSGALLRRQREAVRAHLGDDEEATMENLTALGDIYSSVDEPDAADQAFREALDIARRETDRDAMRAIYLTMGTRYWEHDEIAAAREHFGRALALAEDEYDDGDRALALEGLADCDQQSGAYSEAIRKAEEALAIARESGSERIVDLALKLARWRTECLELTEAADKLAIADIATDDVDRSRRAEYLNGRADLLLRRGRYRDAVMYAHLAVTEAEEQRDPVSLLHTLTTLALAHLHQGDDHEAARQITRAMRYRESGRQLGTIALRALTAFRIGHRATAADFFLRLADEAQRRIEHDAQDVAAWDFRGLARCFAVARGRTDEIAAAQAAFRRGAARPDEATPGRDCRLAFLTRQLAAVADRPADLLPVLDDLAVSRPCPESQPR